MDKGKKQQKENLRNILRQSPVFSLPIPELPLRVSGNINVRISNPVFFKDLPHTDSVMVTLCMPLLIPVYLPFLMESGKVACARINVV